MIVTNPLSVLIYLIIHLICGVIAMIIHELPKSIAAHFLTHPLHRPRKMEFIPIRKFIDPIGLLLLTISGTNGMGIGWQKPYAYNPNKLVDKHRSLLPIMLTGQLASIIVMLFLFPLLKFVISLELNYWIAYAISALIRVNFVIFIVNLLPVPPLDMGYMIFAYSPNNYFKLVQNQRYIHSAFILVVALGIIEVISAFFYNELINIFI